MQRSEYLSLVTFSIWVCGFVCDGWIAVVLHLLGAYFSFVTVHDASHRCARLWFGRLSSIPLMIPYDEFAIMHRNHHKHTNHRTLDPDHIVQEISPLLWFFAPELYVRYFINYALQEEANLHSIIGGLCRYLFFIGVFITSAITLGVKWTLLHLLFPSRCAFWLLVYFLDYLPHVNLGKSPKPSVRNLWSQTPAPLWLRVLTQNQCYHKEHHHKPFISTFDLGQNVAE